MTILIRNDIVANQLCMEYLCANVCQLFYWLRRIPYVRESKTALGETTYHMVGVRPCRSQAINEPRALSKVQRSDPSMPCREGLQSTTRSDVLFLSNEATLTVTVEYLQ